MRKYKRMIDRLANSVDYWTQVAMRAFVSEIDRRMQLVELSRAGLAKRIDSSPAYVTKAMRGDVNFTLETMTKLAMAVGGKLEVRVIDRSDAWKADEWYSADRGAAAVDATRFVTIDPEFLSAANAKQFVALTPVEARA